MISPLFHIQEEAPEPVPVVAEEPEMAPRFAGDALRRPEFLALRDTIAHAEGTWDNELGQPDYTMRYGDAPGGGTLDTTQPHPLDVRGSRYGSGFRSNASGAYQWMDDTWSEMNDGVNAVMSPENQDRALNRILTERVGYDYDRPFAPQIPSLSGTWASFPNENGASRYGQPVKDASVLTNHYQQRLDFHRTQAAPQPEVPIAPVATPAVPGPSPVSNRGAHRAAFQ